ncbi:MAG: sugar phosphate isomerase/epimerase family protein [Armatimonadota bacterium]
MKLAYGTYGMPGIRPEDALPRLAEIGYAGVELAVGERFCVVPEQMPPARRTALRELYESLDLAVPALLMLLPVMHDDPDVHRQNLDAFRHGAELAAEITVGRTPVVTTTLGGGGSWEQFREEMLRRLREYAEIAEQAGCTIAIEPHAGGAFDRPERALWVMETLQHPHVKLNFDISHFAVAGYTLEQTVPVLVPYAAHTHVKDGRMVDGKVQFLLPGEGDFDYAAYFRAMAAAGWDDLITVEVSGMVSSRESYDPYAAAAFCFDALAAWGGR